MMAPPADLQLVPVTTADEIATWAQVYNRAAPCHPVGPIWLEAQFRQAPQWDAVLAVREGREVGVAHVEVQHWAATSRHTDAWVTVAPGERGQGVGTALYRHVSAWSRDAGRIGMDIWVAENDPDGPGFWARRGCVEVGREDRCRLDLTTVALQQRAVPERITLVTLAGRPDLEQGLYEVGREAIPDIPGADPYDVGDFEHFRAGELRLPGLIEECAIVAMAGRTVVGYALIVREEARPTVGTHEMTAVARAWRGRGVARAMKEAQIALARSSGLETLEADNERRNAPMRALNASLGYLPIPANIQLRGPLAP
jgi:GNAT superfamily N-acetyltransferase